MRRTLTAMLIVLCPFICSGAWGGTLYVNGSASEFGDGTSAEKPLQTIQEGIDAASDGDEVIVAEGTYNENIRFKGKDIVLRSENPSDPSVVGNTVIDGRWAGAVVTFDGIEDGTCVLSGFTIQYGNAEYGGGICGGTFLHHMHATIENNVIRNNSAAIGGGVAFCAGTIQSNTISGNNASWSGGGIAYCHGVIEKNRISGNSTSGDEGGGVYACNGLIQNNLIAQNSGTGIYSQGGGL